MIVYNLTDYNELCEWHPQKRLALEAAHKYGLDCEIVRHEINKPTKDVVCTLLSGQGFSIARKTVWKKETP